MLCTTTVCAPHSKILSGVGWQPQGPMSGKSRAVKGTPSCSPPSAKKVSTRPPTFQNSHSDTFAILRYLYHSREHTILKMIKIGLLVLFLQQSEVATTTASHSKKSANVFIIVLSNKQMHVKNTF